MKRWQEHIISWIIGILTLGYYYLLQTQIHHEMMREYSKVMWFKASFKEFKEMFDTIKWSKGSFSSLFADECDDRFHAGIIVMNGVGFMLTSYGLLRANRLKKQIFQRLYVEELRKNTPHSEYYDQVKSRLCK